MEQQIQNVKKSLISLDLEYVNAISELSITLEKSYKRIINSYDFDLSKFEITQAVLSRLKQHYLSQISVKQLLDKHKMKDGADFFVETVLFFLKAYLEKTNTGVRIFSEIAIVKKKGAIRPDISIWKEDELIAIVECKTQLGFSRNSWEQEFLTRKKILETSYPNAKFMLLVLTGNNWRGFQNHELIGINLFCLLKDIWPPNYTDFEQVDTPIEKLFESINNLIEDNLTLKSR